MHDGHNVAFRGYNFKAISGWSRAESEAVHGAAGLLKERLLRFIVVGQILLLRETNNHRIVLFITGVKERDSPFAKGTKEIHHQLPVCLSFSYAR